MTRDRLRRVEEVYFRVAGLTPEERGEALSLACGDDAELRREVESLLRHASETDSFLATPALGTGLIARAADDAAPPERDPMLGRVVGVYRLLERIASGGMGTVYLGTRADGSFDQRVAVKVVKRGMDTEEIVRRFRIERQLLANLDHPNIAKLLDGGATDDGLPYLVMEYIEGRPIDEYCRDHATPIPERLRLFLKVCDAVQEAHRSLVVHRDLKPGNILVTEQGEPKLLDFGIARVLSREGVGEGANATEVPERRLTPEYASPEQIEGRPVTTSSDVYALGVILYELLSGQRPYRFQTRTTAEIERLVCDVDPPAPSTAARRGGEDAAAAVGGQTPERLRRRLRGDLDDIVLKAMHKEPSHRYAWVEQFAQDIRRSQAGLTVLARPDTVWYRTGKFVRRNSLATAAALAIVATLSIGSAVIAWQARGVTRQRDQAFLARDQAEQIVKFFQDVLSSANPTSSSPAVTIHAALAASASRADSELKDQPLVAAAVLSAVGATYTGLGQYDQAEACLNEAMSRRRALVGEGHHDYAESMMDLAHLRYATGRMEEAEHLLRRALGVYRKVRGQENIDTGRALNDLGAVLRALNNFDEAKAAYDEALAIRRMSLGNESLPVAETLNNLGGLLMAKGDFAGAEEQSAESLRIRRLLLPPEHALVSQSIANLGVLVATRGDLARGESLMREAAKLEETSLGPDHPEHAITLSSLGTILLRRSDPAGAEIVIRDALRIRRATLPPGDARTAATLANLGQALLRQKKHEEAERDLDEARTVLAAAGTAGAPRLKVLLEDLARLYEETGRPEKAREVLTTIPKP